MPILYLVATPIGNLEDITLRALKVLGDVDLIAAEDTRVTRRLLDRHGIDTPTTSYHEHNRHARTPGLVRQMGTKDVALVSDAGMPGINDPGSELVRAAAEAGIRVVPVPGPSALTSAIAVSGLEIDQFVYLGYLPKKRASRTKLLGSLSGERRTLLLLEAPHRLKGALKDVLETLGDRRMTVCRELTKLHEEVFRGAVSDAIAHFAEPRGEFTLVIDGSGDQEPNGPQSEAEARVLLAELRADGAGVREAVARVMEATGLPRRLVYRLWVEASG